MANKARTVEYNGVQHTFPGDATDDEISQALGAADQQDAVKAKMATPTQFELDRNYNHDRPGAAASLLDTVKSFLKPAAQNPYPGMGIEQKQDALTHSSMQDKLREERGYGQGYRTAAAALPMIDTPGMEEEAAHANPAGVLGHAAGSALPYVIPGAAEGGLKGSAAVLEHPLTAKVVPGAARVMGGAAGYEAGKAMGHPIMGAGAGYELGRDIGPILADKIKSIGGAARTAGNWAGEFMTPPEPEQAPRIPLWKQAGIEAGRPASSMQVTNVPEPTPRLKSVSGGSGPAPPPAPAPTPNAPDMPVMPPHENYGFMPPEHPPTMVGNAWHQMHQTELSKQFGGRPVLVADPEPNAVWDNGKGEVIFYRKPSDADRANMFPHVFGRSAAGGQ